MRRGYCLQDNEKEGYPSLTLYYCRYDGEITLSLREGE